MCRAGVGTRSAHEMTTGGVSDRQISPIKGQIVIYRPSIGPNSLREALRATFVGNHPESSGKSRLNLLFKPGHSSGVEFKLNCLRQFESDLSQQF